MLLAAATATVVAAAGWLPASAAAPRVPTTIGDRGRVGSHSAPMRPGELLVKRVRGRSSAFALQGVGGRATATLGDAVDLVKVPPGQEHLAAQRLASDPSIVYAEPNYVRTAASHSAGELTWGVRRTRADTVWHDAQPATGANVRVAVLDSGVDRTHPELASRVRPGFDPYGTDGRDECGHGTAVAGVIAAAQGNGGTVGVAPRALIVPVKVLRFEPFFGMCGGDDASIVRGLRWAATTGRADIINMSLSGPSPSRALRDAINEAVSQGVLVVAAAGNSGDRTINYPAAYPEVISVGGLQRSGTSVRWWRHSSFGKVDVAAAGQAVPVIQAAGVSAGTVGRPCPAGDGHRLCADGTSFAAPHVAGIAALLHERHNLRTVSPGARLLRLRQWILATAPDVPGTRGGVSLHAGHGSADARGAMDASTNAARTLVTWQTAPKILAPNPRMAVMPSARRFAVVVTSGTGEPRSGVGVRFTAPRKASVSVRSATVPASGQVPTVFRSPGGGRRTAVVAEAAGQSLPLETYVLQRDENAPGIPLRRLRFRNRLDGVYDADDVFRIRLLEGEIFRADARAMDLRRQVVDLYLHRGTTRDVTDPRLAPLAERGAAFANNPRRLRVKVHSDGRRYLDVYGRGTYRLVWWVVSPGKLRNVSARPATFSPDGDGTADRTTIRWRQARRGKIALRIRNRSGRLVRTVRLGAQSRGAKVYRWNGRNNGGQIVRNGRYRVTVRWSGVRGRMATKSTHVVVRR